MTHLTDKDKAELLEDARAATLQAEFAGMNTRLKKLTPLEWLVFLTDAAKLSLENTRNRPRIQGDNFLL